MIQLIVKGKILDLHKDEFITNSYKVKNNTEFIIFGNNKYTKYKNI